MEPRLAALISEEPLLLEELRVRPAEEVIEVRLLEVRLGERLALLELEVDPEVAPELSVEEELSEAALEIAELPLEEEDEEEELLELEVRLEVLTEATCRLAFPAPPRPRPEWLPCSLGAMMAAKRSA